jgi:uncharacterized protein (TIGR00299 family) protein
MRIAYLDCFSGVSGDMFLGALVDAGVPAGLLEETAAALNVGARLEISKVVRSGIAATKVDVFAHGEKDLPREMYWAQRNEAQANHKVETRAHRAHGIESEEAPESPVATHSHEHGHGRGLTEIRAIIGKANIGENAKKTALNVFQALGEAEAKIHNTSIEKIHFHEVGAVDAMVDIVCAAVGADTLGIDEWVCSPLNVGGGTVRCAHGILPVPAPATVEILKNAPVYSSGLNVELVTPTGAAIVKTLANRFAPFPEMTIETCGYGAGTREFPGQPNVLRLSIGTQESSLASKTSHETITVLEANLDDLNPQIVGYALERLLEEGALDAFALPVQMKKSRPGTLLTVITTAQDAARLTHVIFKETSTLGVRRRDEKRQVLARRFENVRTQWGDVRVKIASMNGTITNYAPEYEDCRRIAAQHHVPLKDVMHAATREYLQRRKA